MSSTSQEQFQRIVGQRVKLAREDANLNQDELARELGFKDRQTLSNIEAGKRKLTAEELVKLIQVLGKKLEYFTDTFSLVGEGAFSWRARDAAPASLDNFEARAGRWIATFRRLGEMKDEPYSPLSQQLNLTERSSFEEAQSAGEALVKDWRLGDIPAQQLHDAVEDRLNILILFVDAPVGISGAACQLPEFNTILVNRREPDGRRNYDFAHELFHVLTWNAMPPRPVDQADHYEGTKVKRVEHLAENFAAALLMPAASLQPRWENRGERDLHKWLNETASDFEVTSRALYWRLRQVGWLTPAASLEINPDRLTWNGRSPSTQTLPKLFSRRFVERIHWALEHGKLTVRRAAELLDCTVEDLEKLFRSYDLPVPFDL
ncbi:MAG: ImmA/IrrE family metallo-endopeptidase [Verrucomicrobia bacterium]|jgi:XRE family transcriptional regulator, fatty acid utilization regulator|nr:ImmA/IrrE family metallo-endopeptidase [Verrucomicrobiota bacterium]